MSKKLGDGAAQPPKSAAIKAYVGRNRLDFMKSLMLLLGLKQLALVRKMGK